MPYKVINTAYRMDETVAVNALLKQVTLSDEARLRIEKKATELVTQIRKRRRLFDAFLHQYDLSSEEGIALMCLAEALLRIPDTKTKNKLIQDKLSSVNWMRHLQFKQPFLLNTATLAFWLTGKIYAHANPLQIIIRPLILQGMKLVGKQFVMGHTIQHALKRAKKSESKGYRYSYDMLGEAAKTQRDAENYFQSYLHAIQKIGESATQKDPMHNPGISVKLSALHPRYEYAKRERVLKELTPRLLTLAIEAKKYAIGLTVDAEETDRLELSLDIIENVFSHSALAPWTGFGLAVQAYQKRAPFVIDALADLSKRYHRRIMVRLVKGAYWDAEIKHAQLLGLAGYPVFTRKNTTDISYLICAKKLLAHLDCFYPQFGTHNAYSVSAILEMAGNRNDFEFQRLHGMGDALYDQIISKTTCRIYAPVGHHQELLSYLVRRLLENGANTSFINMLSQNNTTIEKLLADPIEKIVHLKNKPHPHIPLPQDIYMNRKNAVGFDLSDSTVRETLLAQLEKEMQQRWESSPLIAGKKIQTQEPRAVFSPINPTLQIGQADRATMDDVETALASASIAAPTWARQSVNERATALERAADLFEKESIKLIAILCREGGKTIPDSISEIREAIDFCRYYALRAREDLKPITLKGVTGESNQLTLHARGIIACISPWNFPLAIFIGQITAALAAGNAVIAKPAEQTSLIAAFAIALLHQAGIPKEVLHFLPGRGEIVGAKLVEDERINGIMLTGSTETAKFIQRQLAKRQGAITPLIAETGGQNAMIVDSSALPEQVVSDVIQSAFNSAGQRCSALRVLFLQEEIALRVLDMLQGAMAELSLGDPTLLETDIGPVIDKNALTMLQKHAEEMKKTAKLIYEMSLPSSLSGYFFTPCVFEIKHIGLLKGEVFGPILHVVRYAESQLDEVLDSIKNTGFGLTLGIHSRIETKIKYIQSRMPVGNIYVNRNMIGAVVGVQPFGGEGLSGTGPKAGGPHYLPRLCVERAVSINTTATGGNAELISLSE